MVTSRRRPTATGSARRTTPRRVPRTTIGGRRRRTPRTSTTLGGAFALAVVALFTRASWPIRIGLIVIVLVAAAGYFVVQARRGGLQPAADVAPEGRPAAEPAPPVDPKDTHP